MTFSIICPCHPTPAISILLNPSLIANLRPTPNSNCPSGIGAISATAEMAKYHFFWLQFAGYVESFPALSITTASATFQLMRK